MADGIERFQQLIDSSCSIVFFGGAGVSTESGIPDFRSTDGLYHQKWAQPPEEILSHHFFQQHTEEFFAFYRQKMIFPDAKPNAAHLKLAELERKGKLTAVVTQNIDGLHQAAGSEKVLELHGSVLRNFCMDCGAFYGVEYILHSEGTPRCSCGGIVKPDVVLYEESLDDGILNESIQAISSADMLIIGGTSLAVFPAASLIHYYRGKRLVLINKTPTSCDSRADLLIAEPIGGVFAHIVC